MNNSDIDINELRRNNVEFLIKKYKEEKHPIVESVLRGVIEDLEISQKEWVEYDDEEHPNSQSSVRSDEYLKNKEKYKLKNRLNSSLN
jgi:hypothetical protein